MAENVGVPGQKSPLRRLNNRPSPRKHPYERVGKVGSTLPAKTATAPTTVRSPLKNIQAPLGSQKALAQGKVGGVLGQKTSPNKGHNAKGKQILEYLQLAQIRKTTTEGPHPHQSQAHIQIYTEDEEDKVKEEVGVVEEGKEVTQSQLPRRDFGVIGEHRKSSGGGGGNSSFGFIPVDKSCVIAAGGAEIHCGRSGGSSGSSLFNLSGTSSLEMSVDVEEEEEEEVKKEEQSSWNPFSSGVNVTRGVLGSLQPRGLNSSFTEKFVSRLEINSEAKSSDPSEDSIESEPKNDENAVPRSPGGHVTAVVGVTRQPFSHKGGLLMERISPLFECSEYVNEILRYCAKLEVKFRVKPDYMDRHSEISHKMRTILLDWLVEVVSEYDLNEETLHLTVNYLDRFLCRMNVKRTKLQLVGAAALFIASKFEEMSPPEINDLVYVTDDAYKKEEILSMEGLMLTCLEFDLMMPTAHNLALSYCSLLQLTDPARPLAMYLVNLSLMEGEIFLKFLPSVIAGAAVALARFSFGGTFWDSALQKHCGHRKSTIIPAVKALHTAFFDAPTKSQTSIYEKYCSVRYCSVARAFIPNNGPWDA